jgi:integrase
VKEGQLIVENPCRIPGYDKKASPERPVGTIPQVIALSELVAYGSGHWSCLRHSRVRVVALPAMLVDAMTRHLAEFPAEDEGLIFRGPLGAPLRRNNFHRSVRWSQSVVQAGLPAGFHFHDLRHTGNNLAAASGATPAS